MGLFSRKAKPAAPQVPAVFISQEESMLFFKPAQTSRFFFMSTLIEPGKWEKSADGKSSRHTGMTVLPNRNDYLALMQQLGAVINATKDLDGYLESSVRCYPHYIALTWEPELQPEENVHEAAKRIEAEVTSILAKYFGWEKPYQVGRFRDSRERFKTAERFGVSWMPGSYH